jgi:Short C-terminal domain
MFPRRGGEDARISDLEQSPQQSAPQQSGPQQSAPSAPEQQADLSVFGQLSQLVQMHDRGALTDEEFSAAKARLLG